MIGRGDATIAGEHLPRWLPLPLAAIGIIGSIAAAQMAVGALDERSDADMSPPAGPAVVSEDADAAASSVDVSSPDDGDDQASEQSTPSSASAASAERGSTEGGSAEGGSTGGAGSADSRTGQGAGSADDGSGAAEDCPPLFEVLFPLGRADVPIGLEVQAQRLASWMAAHPEAELLVDGHADAAGSEQANLELSFRRAEAAAALIVRSGVAADRVTPRGFGEYQPIAGEPPDSERNRRVTMHVPGRENCPIQDPDHDKEATE